jgi:hypothetical protein
MMFCWYNVVSCKESLFDFLTGENERLINRLNN